MHDAQFSQIYFFFMLLFLAHSLRILSSIRYSILPIPFPFPFFRFHSNWKLCNWQICIEQDMDKRQLFRMCNIWNGFKTKFHCFDYILLFRTHKRCCTTECVQKFSLHFVRWSMQFCPNGSSHGSSHGVQHIVHSIKHTIHSIKHTVNIRTVLIYTRTVMAYTHDSVCVYFVQPDCTLTAVCITNKYDVMFTFLHWMRFVCFVSFRLHSVATHKESYERRRTVWGKDLDWIQQNLHRNLFFVLLFWTQHVCVCLRVRVRTVASGIIMLLWVLETYSYSTWLRYIVSKQIHHVSIIYLYATCASFNCFRSYSMGCVYVR